MCKWQNGSNVQCVPELEAQFLIHGIDGRHVLLNAQIHDRDAEHVGTAICFLSILYRILA
jgi:hypothetical protein